MRKVCLRRFLLVCFSCCSLAGWLAAQPCTEIVGYYASWKWYKRDKLVNPVTIDYSRYTIINYAFFKPLSTGAIIEGDQWADKNILLGKLVTQNGTSGHDAASSLVVNAHKNQVKVVASVGGWTWSSSFPEIAADKQKREIFAAACADLIRTYDFDGIDIDWEFPGSKLHNGSVADFKNFTLLLQAIRSKLTICGEQTGKKLLLTAAFGPAPVHIDRIEWEEVAPLLDMIHVMTYNYYGAWDKITNHNTPLNPVPGGNPDFAISSTIQRLTTMHHVPASKITLGIAFYGRSVILSNAPALHVPSSGIPDEQTFKEEKGTPSYYSIVAKSHLFHKQWDDMANVPFMTGKNGLNSFVSYDDPESVKLKAAFAMKMQLLGAVIWDISGDYLETYAGSGVIAGTPLADAIHETFLNATSKIIVSKHSCSINLLAYPNPFRDEVDLNWNTECDVLKIIVRNQAGQVVYLNEKITNGKLKIVTAGWISGWYSIQLFSESGTSGQSILKI